MLFFTFVRILLIYFQMSMIPIEKQIKFLTISILLLKFTLGLSQQTQKYHSPEHEFLRAKEMFQMEQYESSKSLFKSVYDQIDKKFDPKKQEALYYQTLCASILCHDDAEQLAYFFASEYPQYMNIKRIWFHLGEYLFMSKQYKKALNEFQKVDERILTPEEQIAYKFKLGYCYFSENQYEQAKPLLAEVMQTENIYQNKATFYYSHILYTEHSYNAALVGFEKLKNAETYSAIVPYYIAHIYFAIGRYEDIIAQKDMLIAKSTAKRLPEINGIVAQSYYQLRDFESAIPYFENYIKSNKNPINDEIYYMLGYCYYHSHQYDNAIEQLTRSIRQNDSLNQYAYFTLADCYLQTQQKEFASRSFLSAHENGNNKLIAEEALYNYAKLQYELSSNPFVGAISAFEKYLNDYPNSNRKNEAEQFLSTIYLTTKNYKAALASLEKIKNKSTTLLKAYQRVAYFRGLEMFNNNNFAEAKKYLDIAINNNYDEQIYAQSLFWTAEIAYQNKNYEQSVHTYNLFHNVSAAKNVEEYPMSFYNAGYADFKLKRYKSALSKFCQFENLQQNITDKKIIADAYNRIGDCYFMQSNLEQAKAYYNKTINLNTYDVDYALFQKAQSEGGLRQYNEKTQTMNQLTQQYPQSSYVGDAEYEIANTYLTTNRNTEALNAYANFVQKHPKHPLVKEAYLKMGSIYYNTEQDDEALKIYKTLVEKYPNTDEASRALKSIENIYIASGNVDDFFAYVKQVSSEKITVSYQDSITYNVASEKYFNKNYIEAEKGFTKYLEKFPNGVFSEKAHFYKGECAMRRNDFAQALPAYEYVIANGKDDELVQTSLYKAAFILCQDSNFSKAQTYYNTLLSKTVLPSYKLNSIMGLTKCAFFEKDYPKTIEYGQMLIADDKTETSQRQEARLLVARSAMMSDNFALAKQQYSILSQENKSEAVSEALYQLAFIEYKGGDLDKAEKQIFNMLVNITDDYWLAKSYILLGDIYLDKGNSFQAKHTYLSIMENYDGEELKNEATLKYQKIIDQENKEKEKETTNDEE